MMNPIYDVGQKILLGSPYASSQESEISLIIKRESIIIETYKKLGREKIEKLSEEGIQRLFAEMYKPKVGPVEVAPVEIMGPVEVTFSEEELREFKVGHEEAKRVMEKLNQIKDIRKLEPGVMVEVTRGMYIGLTREGKVRVILLR